MVTPIRTFLKHCKQCGSKNPRERIFCCKECRARYTEENKKPKPPKKERRKANIKINKCRNCKAKVEWRKFCNSICRLEHLNKNRLRRPCKKCDEMFKPFGKSNKTCSKCIELSKLNIKRKNA